MAQLLLTVILGTVCMTALTAAHSYHLGSCPNVEPMQDFDINKFLGTWYVVQKTSTGSKCLMYNFTREDNELKVIQSSQHLVLGLTSVDHIYKYTGILETPDLSVPGKMRVKFPLSVAGTSSYVVFSTDYNTYGAVFSCQKLGFGHRKSASILSRTPQLDKLYLEKVRSKLSSYGVDPHDLSIIEQTDCPKPSESGYNIDIDDDTFSAGSIAGVVRGAGEKIGDGIEGAADIAKNLYNKYGGDKDNIKEDVGDVIEAHGDAEWIP